ncbi:MAG: DNA-3-methyladenine glycosylase [Patescibacteria group bacterium]|nr:DNA-3-methyladenine glycosylase [Patescibacteria group bacterium]
MASKTLSQKFFKKPTLEIARRLLGKYLCRRYRGKTIKLMITEVEAYDGFEDKASHASRGITLRNKIMFGPAGYWYVYFTYGIHFMLNIVTGKKGYPAAVLIRSAKTANQQINGPARLTKFLHINKSLNEKIMSRKTSLWIKDGGLKLKPFQIKSSPRIGVNFAGPAWSKKKYRFYIK